MTVGSYLKNHFVQLIVLAVMPVLAVLFFNAVYLNTYIEHLPIAVVDLDNSSLSRSVVRQFSIHPGLKIAKYADSEIELENLILDKVVSGGLIIPAHFAQDVTTKKSPAVLVVVDGTNLVVGNLIQGYSSTILGTVSAGIQMATLEGRGLLPQQAKTTMGSFNLSERILFDPALRFLKNIFHMQYIFVVHTIFFTMFLVPLFTQGRRNWLASPQSAADKRDWVLGVGVTLAIAIVVVSAASYGGLWVAKWTLGTDVRGDFLEHFCLVAIFLLGLTSMALVVSSVIEDTGLFLMGYNIATLLFILTAGVTWPAYMMPEWFERTVRWVWPLMNVTYPFKALHMKSIGWSVLTPTLVAGAVFFVLWGSIGIAMFRRKIRKSSLSQERPI